MLGYACTALVLDLGVCVCVYMCVTIHVIVLKMFFCTKGSTLEDLACLTRCSFALPSNLGGHCSVDIRR